MAVHGALAEVARAARLAAVPSYAPPPTYKRETPATTQAAPAGTALDFYERRYRLRTYGDAPRARQKSAVQRRRLSDGVTDQILALAIEFPALGPRAIAATMRQRRYGGLPVSQSGVWNVLKRAGLNRRAARVAVPELVWDAECGPLTARALREMVGRHQERGARAVSGALGAELFADSVRIGKLESIGPVWQYSIVEDACRFGFGAIRDGRRSAGAAAELLESVVVPAYLAIGVRIHQITTDGGPEFGRAFAEACRRQGIRHLRLPPRSTERKAVVERFQGVGLYEHYQVAFRHRAYSSAAAMDMDFQAWLRYYNFERSQRGGGGIGRPGELFYAGQPELLRANGWDEAFASDTSREPAWAAAAELVRSRGGTVDLDAARSAAVRALLPRPFWLASRVLAAILISSFAAGAMFATADALPDDPLHDAKVATEQVRLALAQSPEERIVVQLAIAGARLREAVLLEAKGQDAQADAAVSGYGEQLAGAAADLQEIKLGAPALVDQFRAEVVRQQQSLPAAPRTATSANARTSALGIVTEIATTIGRDDRIGADGIADAAASGAAKAAANVEKKAAPAIESAMTAPVFAPFSPAADAASPKPEAPSPPATNAPAASAPSSIELSLPQETTSPVSGPAAAPSTAQAGGSPKTEPQAALAPSVPSDKDKSDKDKSDKKKTEAAAKTAQESADRAKQSADRAKQSADKQTAEKAKHDLQPAAAK